MKQLLFNENWKFWNDKNSFALVWNIPETAQEVTLPHDAMIHQEPHADSLNGGNTGFYDGGNYVYVKNLVVTSDMLNQIIALRFDGAYMNTYVYVNGQLAGSHHYGYTGFVVKVNDFVHEGNNEIRVQVRNGVMSNSRWYSGSGLYRDVYLLTSNLLHIEPKGTMVKTLEIDQNDAMIEISVPISNASPQAKTTYVCFEIKDNEGKCICSDKRPYFLYSNESRKISSRYLIKNANTWSAENPSLYTIKTSIVFNGEQVDIDERTFGIRTLSVDSKRGLRINGQTTKLRGSCIHHDQGLLGAATYEASERRRIKILKEAGFNAIRMSHHPSSPVLLKVCDELGMYIMDETFDMWTRFKSDHDYSQFFKDDWKTDVRAMVESDFNHPSVILYSIGNEIPEIATQQGSHLAKEINDFIKLSDDTRPTLAAINGVFASGDSMDDIMNDVLKHHPEALDEDGNVNDFMSALEDNMDEIVTHDIVSKNLEVATAMTDIAGYNYMTARYEKDSKEYPNRVMVGSETYPPEIARNWKLVKELPSVIGDFTWTGWDYIGEAGIGIPAYREGEGGLGATYPCQLAYCGDIDITGFRRPMSYYREIVFGKRKAPYIAVQNPYHYGETLLKTSWIMSDVVSSWTWSGAEHKPVIVEVYAPGDEVELYLNDRLIERKNVGEEIGYLTRFETVYEPGELKAINYQNGEVISSTTLNTANKNDSHLAVQAENQNEDLIYLSIENRDNQNRVITDLEKHLKIAVEGADLLAFGSANPKPTGIYQSCETTTFNGRALAILRKNQNVVKVCVNSGQESCQLLLD